MTIPNHGGDVLSYEKYYDGEILDFSSNINPLGYPEGLEKGLKDSMDQLLVYPDIHYRKLKENLKDYLNVNPEHIVVGNGAMEVLDSVIAQFSRIITPVPAFSEYKLRAQVHGLDLVKVDLNRDMSVPIDKIKEISVEGDLVLLTSPHNPSGVTLEKDEVLELYMDLVEKNGYLLLDEAFFEFGDMGYDTIELFEKLGYHNIGIVRAATKFFGVPGIRLGYGVFDCEMVQRLEEHMMPWSVNAFAVAASDYLFDKDYIEASKEYIINERRRYVEELRSISGIHPYHTNSNYVLLKVEGISEEDLFYKLLKKGLLVRRCSNYDNLNGVHIRVAIKTTEENNKLLKHLREIMEEK